MEEYLQCMKTLRSQMNDVEEQAAKISVEEQMQITTIQTLQKDLDSARSEIQHLKLDTERMVKAKGQICSQILEKQRRIILLESESSTLSQTLELIQQERVNLSAKLMQKSTHYTKVAEDIRVKLETQQEWMSSHKLSSESGQQVLIEGRSGGQIGEANGMTGKHSLEDYLTAEDMDGTVKALLTKLESAQAKLDMMTQTKSKLPLENCKVRQSMDLVKSRISNYKPELQAMNAKTLEEEHQALLSDKAGESGYLQSLQLQSEKLKDITHMVKCACGEEYKVAVDLCL